MTSTYISTNTPLYIPYIDTTNIYNTYDNMIPTSYNQHPCLSQPNFTTHISKGVNTICVTSVKLFNPSL